MSAGLLSYWNRSELEGTIIPCSDKYLVTNWHKTWMPQLIFLSLETWVQGAQFPAQQTWQCPQVFCMSPSATCWVTTQGKSPRHLYIKDAICVTAGLYTELVRLPRIEASCSNRSLFVYWLNSYESTGSPAAVVNDRKYTSVLRAFCTASLDINTVS
jgi:hypothetical protein